MLAQEVAVSRHDRARVLSGADRHRVLAIVDHLGVDPERVATTDRLSPGEARKLVLADLLARPREVLVLDEPTNHLDIEAIGRLQDALTGFAGALVLVTHDEELAAATTDLTWTVGDGRVVTSSRSRHPLAPDPSDLIT
jgi:ATPase subunit of ABC transporter with duplicated ATPase domains